MLTPVPWTDPMMTLWICCFDQSLDRRARGNRWCSSARKATVRLRVCSGGTPPRWRPRLLGHGGVLGSMDIVMLLYQAEKFCPGAISSTGRGSPARCFPGTASASPTSLFRKARGDLLVGRFLLPLRALWVQEVTNVITSKVRSGALDERLRARS
jgi:hypothetical protein